MRPRRRLSPEELIRRQSYLWRQRASQRDDAAQEGGRYISISRECGCGALQVADELVDRLGWTVYDRRFIDDVASDAAVTRLLLDSLDAPSRLWLESQLEGFDAAVDGSFYRRIVRVICAIAWHGDAIFIGRGAHRVLPADWGVRVKLVAPVEHRIRSMVERDGLLDEEARQHVARADTERAAFLEQLFAPWTAEQPGEFDRVFDMSRVSHTEAAEAIVELAVLKLGVRPASEPDGTAASHHDGTWAGATFDPSAMSW